jgi:hypothetical protein
MKQKMLCSCLGKYQQILQPNMHNIRTNFSKFYRICKELFEKK